MIQTDITTLKTVAKNIRLSLENDYNTKLSNSASLQLAAKGFGYKNYNTAKSLLKDTQTLSHTFLTTDEREKVFGLIRFLGLNKAETNQIIDWYQEYIKYPVDELYKLLTELIEFKETENETENIESILYNDLYSLLIEDAILFMPFTARKIMDYSTGEEYSLEVATSLKNGIIAPKAFADNLQISQKDLSNAINQAKKIGCNVLKKAQFKLIDSQNIPHLTSLLHVLKNSETDMDSTYYINPSKLRHIFGSTPYTTALKSISESIATITINGKKISSPIFETYGIHQNGTVEILLNRIFTEAIKYISIKPLNKAQSLELHIKAISLINDDNYLAEYINSLSLEEYIDLQAIFWLGRSGWERNYYETNEYYNYIESANADGYKPTQEELDDKFLTNEDKLKQWEYTLRHSQVNTTYENNSYNHDYLSEKMDLYIDLKKGFTLLSPSII